jgi:UDP-N-acetylglucosamine 4,6-dehydratase
MFNLAGKSILLTGGTGSFGTEFVKTILQDGKVEQIIVYSRDELKQFEMAERFQSSKLKFILGDIRDNERLKTACADVQVIIHAAAMKQIPASESNPIEAIKTNVLGAQNVVSAAIDNGVERVIALSTDKAANPANLYGATKLCSDKLMMAGNSLRESSSTKFSVVRYGNVLGSRGSVIPFFLHKAKEGVIPITDENMTRFWLTLQDGVQFVLSSLERMYGGEIFVPKIPSFKVVDVAEVVCPGIPIRIIGIRPGEKLHEVMITEDDSLNTFEFDQFYAIVAPGSTNVSHYKKSAKKVSQGFKFSSDNNTWWHTHDSFKKLLIAQGIIN